jgi:hypothetical protein
MSLAPQNSLPPGLRQLLSITLTEEGWERLSQALETLSLEKVRQHRLAPWLYYRVKQQGYEDRLPARLLQTLRGDFSQHVLLSTLQQQEMQRLLPALFDAEIDFILLKGADLRLRVYPDPALRPMDDLDLLLAPGDIAKAAPVLTQLGYRLYSGHQDQRLIINEVLYSPPEKHFLHLDLHSEIVAACSFYQLPYRPLRAAAVTINGYGTTVLVLSPEHALIHLCLHAYGNFPVASQILDLALVLSRLTLNWPRVIQEATRFGCQCPVHLMLQEAAQIVPDKVPAAVLTQLSRHRPSFLEMMVLRPQLRYLTCAFPYFFRHRSVRDWFRFIGANLWPQREILKTCGGRSGRGRVDHLQNLLNQFLSKLRSKKSSEP